MQAALSFLHVRTFKECPEFGFDQCDWRFTPYEEQGGFDGNANVAHGWFDAHKQHFSPGIRDLLELQEEAEKWGMSIWAKPSPLKPMSQRTELASSGALSTPSGASSTNGSAGFEFDVALSFAGPQRPLAQELAERLVKAGVKVFYDDLYPEQLWGKDLTAFFDSVYRKQSRYCVMFISHEYVERMWTSHEARSARARALREKGSDYILPIQVEAAEVPGLPDTIAFLPLERYTIAQIAELFLKKLRG